MIIHHLTVFYWTQCQSQHYVSRLKSIAIEAYKYYVNEYPEYINGMLDPLNKPYDLRGGSRAERFKEDNKIQ